MPTALLSRNPASATEERSKRRSSPNISVVAGESRRVSPERLGHVVFGTWKAIGWVSAFLTTHTHSSRSIVARVGSLRRSPSAGARIAAFSAEVERMLTLPSDWNGFGSDSPNEFAREVAKQILLTTTTLIVPDRVAPSAQGGVGICFTKAGKYADIEVLNSGEILATTSDGKALPDVWEVRPTDLKGALDRIVRFVNS